MHKAYEELRETDERPELPPNCMDEFIGNTVKVTATLIFDLSNPIERRCYGDAQAGKWAELWTESSELEGATTHWVDRTCEAMMQWTEWAKQRPWRVKFFTGRRDPERSMR
jgi:hypothetical protein